VSTDEQAREGCSLDNQEARIRAYAESQEWNLVHIYREEGESGKTTKRPQLEALVGGVSGHLLFDVVLVYKVDRLTRRQRDLWNILQVFEINNVAFKSVTEPFDTTTAQGKAFLGMLAVFAQLERDTIAERTKDALAHKKANGEPVGAPPYGYRMENGKLVEDEEEISDLAFMVHLRVDDGYTYQQIAESFNVRKIPCKRRGGKWHASTIRNVLTGGQRE